jgi:hypothetical protein
VVRSSHPRDSSRDTGRHNQVLVPPLTNQQVAVRKKKAQDFDYFARYDNNGTTDQHPHGRLDERQSVARECEKMWISQRRGLLDEVEKSLVALDQNSR